MVVDSLIDALAVSFGPTLAVVVGAIISQRAANQAIKAADRAQQATARAALDAVEAQRSASVAAAQAADAARRLVLTAQASDNKLDIITGVTEATHQIVNSQRTAMAKEIKDQRDAIDDLKSQIAVLLDKLGPHP